LDDYGIGAYLQAGLTAWEKLEFSAGLHGDYEYKDAALKTFFANPDPFLPPPTKLSPSRDFAEVTPQASVAWHFTPADTLYATVGRGYKAGGFNPLSPANKESYGEEHSWNYETGLKTSWLDNRLALNLSAFYIDWQDLQLNLPTGVPAQFYIANAGSAYSKGAELEIRARPFHGLDLFASAGYTDARFLSDARAGHIDSIGTTSEANVSGKHLIFTPDYTASAGAQYSWAICAHTTLYARGEVDIMGRYFYNAVNTAAQSAYSLADFRVGVRTGRWFAEAWIRNAFDSHYVPIAFEFPNGAFGGSGFVGESGAPQTYGVRAGFTF
jgi:iron complex outermembrane receptor protein